MVWDEDNEIWKSNGESQHHYAHQTYFPSIINDAHNKGESGAYYPVHDDYKKDKEGYFIWYGWTRKNDLKHAFESFTYGEKDEDLATKAKDPQFKKDKFYPIALVTLSGMTCESDGWKYKRRTEPLVISEELSAVENDSVDLVDRFVP